MTDIARLEAEVTRLRAELDAERQDTVAWLESRGEGDSPYLFFRGVRAAYRAAAMCIQCGQHRTRSVPANERVGDGA